MVTGITITDTDLGIDNYYAVNSKGSLELMKQNVPVIPIQKQINTTLEFQPWGIDNKEPFRILDEGNSITEIQSGLDFKARMLYGNGFFVTKVTGIDEEGNEILKPIWNTEINKFLNEAGFQRYLLNAATNLYWFNIVFPNVILSKDRTKITNIAALDTSECRLAKQNTTNGLIEKTYISANWRTVANPVDATILPNINPFFPEFDLRTGKNFSYIYPLAYSSPGNKYYPVNSWNAVRKSGWLNVAKKIPEFKNNLFENQSSIKYIINTTKQWWEWKYKGFKEMTQAERNTIINKEKQQFQDAMTSNSAAGKMLMSTGYVDDRGNLIPGWTVETLTNKFASGDYIEDSQEATSKIIAGLGIPSSLLNLLGTGSKMGGGSGTDIRVAFNLYINTIESHRDLILEPWNFALRYNGFGDDLRIVLKYKQITTLENRQETATVTSK